jgi:hypothetical protein
MGKLHVEELEARQLMNGTSFSFRPPPAHPLAAGGLISPGAERSPFVDFGGSRAGPGGLGSPDKAGTESSSSWSVSLRAAEGGPPEAPVLRAPVSPDPGASRPESGDAGALRFVGPLPGTGSAGVNVAFAEPVPETAAPRPNLQPFTLFENPVGALGVRALVQIFSAALYPAGTVREGDRLYSPPEGLPRLSPLPSPGTEATPPPADQPREPSEARPGLPSPQWAGVLPFLPAFDAAVLEHGM